MKRIKNILYMPLAIVMLLTLSLSSCNFIYDDYPEGEEDKAYILLSLDGDKVTTRGGDLIVDDAVIEKIRIIVFDHNSTVEKNQLFKSGYSDFENPFRVQLKPGTKNVYVIANETTGLTESLTSGSLTETGLKAIMADNITSPLVSPLVMTGEIPSVELLTAGLHNATVKLKRVAAKINLKFKKDTDPDVPVIINKVSLLKNTGKSTLWEGASIVGSQSYWSHSVNNTITLTSTEYDYLTVYVYENLVNSANNKANATQLVVEAIYNGLPSIYRVYVNENVSSVVNAGDPSSSETDPADHIYNIKRNYQYNLTGTIKALGDFQGLTIVTEVKPWEGVNKTYFVGYGYTVEVDGKNVTVSNHDKDCAPHSIKLEALNGLTFDGGGNERTFEETGASDTATYTLSDEPQAGQSYLKVYYNDVLVNTFTK